MCFMGQKDKKKKKKRQLHLPKRHVGPPGKCLVCQIASPTLRLVASAECKKKEGVSPMLGLAMSSLVINMCIHADTFYHGDSCHTIHIAMVTNLDLLAPMNRLNMTAEP